MNKHPGNEIYAQFFYKKTSETIHNLHLKTSVNKIKSIITSFSVERGPSLIAWMAPASYMYNHVSIIDDDLKKQ